MNSPEWKKSLHNQRGVTVVLVAILLLALIAITSLAVDIGYVMATRNELQNVADAGALAGARQLGVLYEEMGPGSQDDYVCDPGTIIPVVQETGALNTAAGVCIAIDAAEVVIGRWNSTSRTFAATLSQPNAVKVTARRDGSANGPITTFFAQVINIDSVPVRAEAIAALTGESTSDPLDLEIPVGISLEWFVQKGAFCGEYIKFYPTGTLDGCAGWHTYTSWPSNAAKLADALTDLENGQTPVGVPSEPVTTGDEFVFTGGTVASAFDEMKSLFESKRENDADGNPNTWTTKVIIYDPSELSSPCGNPTGRLNIVGFATIVIEQVLETPEKTIWGRVICDEVSYGRGSGGNYGTMGSIPGLVE
jgi:Flp pilus assembly protein TadG